MKEMIEYCQRRLSEFPEIEPLVPDIINCIFAAFELGKVAERQSLDNGLCEKPLPACAFEEFQTVVDALKNVLKANDDFRAGMPPDWEGDPLQDACDAAKASLALLHEEQQP